MGVTSADINAVLPDIQRIELDVYVHGQKIARATGVDVSMGLSQINATAQIAGIDRGDAVEGQRLEVWAGYNGRTDILFKGEVAGLAWRHAPTEQPLTGRDKFARTRLPWGGEDREYNSTDDAAFLRNLLEAMGIPSYEANIESSSWTLATAQPIIARSGQPFFSWFERVDRLAGYRTFTDRAGNILRRRISGNIGGGAYWEYEEGENIISCARERTVEGIVNRAVVEGLNYEGLQIGPEEAAASNPFIPSPPDFVTEEIQDDLIEDNPTALSIAKRTVADKNRRPETVTLTVPMNPKIVPGMVIRVTHSELELSSGSRFMVDSVQHRITVSPPSAQTTIRTLGGALVNAETNLAPIASFVASFFQEAEDTGSGVESRIILVADGSSSYDPDGTTLTYAWTFAVDAGSVTPSSPTTAQAVAVISGAATTIDITLVVTDADGATGTLGPQTFPLSQGTMPVEPLYLAWDDGVIEASIDGELTWNSYTISGGGTTCTAPFAAPWGTIWGASNGHIYMTIDDLVTAAADTGAPGGGAVDVTAVAIHELDSTRGWAGLSNGRVYQGEIDVSTPTITWTLRGTIPEGPVYEIREAVGSLGSLRATAGLGYYASEDGGLTWTKLHSFADDAQRMLAGFEQNWATSLNDAAAIYAETGTTPTLPMGVDSIPAATFGWRTQAAYAADDADPANLYSTDATFAAFVDTTDDAPGPVHHMIRSGAIDGPVIYLATGNGTGDSGPAKWIPEIAAPWYLRILQDQTCRMIGYGPTRLPVAEVDFVFGTYRLTDPALDGFWRYNFGVWTHIAPPVGTEEWAWLAVAASPYAKGTWLAFGMLGAELDTYTYTAHLELSGTATLRTSALSPLWLTRDFGATWQEVVLPGTGLDPYGGVRAIGWQEQSGRWFALGVTVDVTGSVHTAAFWTGSGAGDAELTRPAAPLFQDVVWGASGSGGDIVASEDDSPGLGTAGRLAYIPNDGETWYGETWATNVGGWNHPRGPLDCIKGQRTFWQVNTRSGDRGIATWEDYRTTDPASVTAVPYTRANDYDGDVQYVAVGDTHVFFTNNEGGSVGIYRRPHATWTPSGAPDYAVAGTYYGCATDRQSRRLFVAYVSISSVYQFVVHDGRVFSAIALPDPDIGTALAGAGGIYKDQFGVPFAALGEVSLV